jgi:S-disulfanyl-L-cysteine oxidoreductase SoxD
MKVTFRLKAAMVIAIALAAVVSSERALRAQAAESVWNGVYSDAQAERGGTLYGQNCASCHGDHLQGKHPTTPALAGDTFKGNWSGQTLNDLFEKIQTTMPADQPGHLSREQNADILAFVLKSNQFPAGKDDLPTDAEKLKQIRFEAARPAH